LGIDAHCARLIAYGRWCHVTYRVRLAQATHDLLEGVGRQVGGTMKLPRVLIAGGGVAGLETLLALRALAGDRVDITILAPT
jgi:NADPH-dependent 2,4-dienoyl-CoA reductase/sulfur reductase-like enzyme